MDLNDLSFFFYCVGSKNEEEYYEMILLLLFNFRLSLFKLRVSYRGVGEVI